MTALEYRAAPRVERVIDEAMKRYPRTTPKALARYYEEVHQELAPLAREMERELQSMSQKADDLAALVRRLVRGLRKSDPDSELAAAALEYLSRNGFAAHVLREEG